MMMVENTAATSSDFSASPSAAGSALRKSNCGCSMRSASADETPSSAARRLTWARTRVCTTPSLRASLTPLPQMTVSSSTTATSTSPAAAAASAAPAEVKRTVSSVESSGRNSATDERKPAGVSPAVAIVKDGGSALLATTAAIPMPAPTTTRMTTDEIRKGFRQARYSRPMMVLINGHSLMTSPALGTSPTVVVARAQTGRRCRKLLRPRRARPHRLAGR